MNPINRIGQKVICIFPQSKWAEMQCQNVIKTAPREGQVYTVTGFQSVGGSPGIHLRENAALACQCGKVENYPWPICAFHPLDERRTDIGVFTKILRSAKKPEKV